VRLISNKEPKGTYTADETDYKTFSSIWRMKQQDSENVSENKL
jgi:hypothetical protein